MSELISVMYSPNIDLNTVIEHFKNKRFYLVSEEYITELENRVRTVVKGIHKLEKE